jgi:uncharacterized membrane protein
MGRSTRISIASLAQVPAAIAVDLFTGRRDLDLLAAIGVVMVLAPVLYLLARPMESMHVCVAPLSARVAERGVERGAADRVLRAAIERLELATSCELRIHVEERPTEASANEARVRFRDLRMHTAVRRNALLIVVWPNQCRIAVVADEGISDIVGRASLRRALARGSGDDWPAHVAAISHALATLLAPFFPHPDDDVNELPDDISWAGP